MCRGFNNLHPKSNFLRLEEQRTFQNVWRLSICVHPVCSYSKGHERFCFFSFHPFPSGVKSSRHSLLSSSESSAILSSWDPFWFRGTWSGVTGLSVSGPAASCLVPRAGRCSQIGLSPNGSPLETIVPGIGGWLREFPPRAPEESSELIGLQTLFPCEPGTSLRPSLPQFVPVSTKQVVQRAEGRVPARDRAPARAPPNSP